MKQSVLAPLGNLEEFLRDKMGENRTAIRFEFFMTQMVKWIEEYCNQQMSIEQPPFSYKDTPLDSFMIDLFEFGEWCEDKRQLSISQYLIWIFF